jgi:hypothetical protein
MLFSGVSVSAKNDDQSLRDLRLYKVVFAARGFSCRDSVEGRFLSQGQTYTVNTKLYAENDYILMAAGNEHVRDIDILLHDENHGEIAKDGKRDSTPMVSVSPKWSGDFHAIVTMYRGRGYSNLMICWKKRN